MTQPKKFSLQVNGFKRLDFIVLLVCLDGTADPTCSFKSEDFDKVIEYIRVHHENEFDPQTHDYYLISEVTMSSTTNVLKYSSFDWWVNEIKNHKK